MPQSRGPDLSEAMAIAAKINKDYFEATNVMVIAYLNHGEMDSWYRLRLTNRYDVNHILLDNLELTVDGHTINQAFNAVIQAYHRGWEVGQSVTIQREYHNRCAAMGVDHRQVAEHTASHDAGQYF